MENALTPAAFGPHPANRTAEASATGFSLALEEDDIQNVPHGMETVGWMALYPGSGVWSGHAYKAGNTANAVTHDWYTIGFASSFSQVPRFIAWMPTTDGGDTSGMRYRNLSKTSVQVRVEEDTTLDSETRHTTEVVSYLAIQGNGTLMGQVYGGRTETKYYYAGTARVAVRKNGALYYLLSDHLGSTSVTADAAGNKVAELRYFPFGEVRYAWGSQVTDFTYTGQRSEMDAFGLMYYQARWYDPALGRFAQTDTLVPESGNPLAYDRYAYVYNNPLRYVDPSGHGACDGPYQVPECNDIDPDGDQRVPYPISLNENGNKMKELFDAFRNKFPNTSIDDFMIWVLSGEFSGLDEVKTMELGLDELLAHTAMHWLIINGGNLSENAILLMPRLTSHNHIAGNQRYALSFAI